MVLFVPVSSKRQPQHQPSHRQQHHVYQKHSQHQQHVYQQQTSTYHHDHQHYHNAPASYQQQPHHQQQELPPKQPKRKMSPPPVRLQRVHHFGIAGASTDGHPRPGHHRRTSSSSVSSTITVDNENNICTELLEYIPQSMLERRVHFCQEHENQVLEYELDETIDIAQDLWYTKEELAYFKEITKEEGKWLSHMQSQQNMTCLAYRNSIKTLLEACDRAAALLTQGSHPGCSSGMLSNCPPPNPDDLIHPLLASGRLQVLERQPGLLGLERWMKCLRRDKSQHLREMRLYIRAKEASLPPAMANRDGGDPYDNDDDDGDDDELYYYYQQEWLRWHCERISLSSRLFSHYVALAQHFHYDD